MAQVKSHVRKSPKGKPIKVSAYFKAKSKISKSKKKGTYIGFKALAAKTSPAIAAFIGREKYGKKGFAALSKAGKK